MKNIKQIIIDYLVKSVAFLAVLSIAVFVLTQIVMEQTQVREDSQVVFQQMEQMLVDNERELQKVQEEYQNTCLYHAENAAYIIQHNPSVLESVEQLKEIAEFVQVDEIHVFDQTGCIVAGTHPEYYGYTFDSGEQMNFFKPMLEDKSLRLVQEPAPNTAEGKWMQYSALWSEDGTFILEVGMKPVKLMEATEKNELSYIFSMLRIDPGISFYAIHAESGEIEGATVLEDVGKTAADIGLDMTQIEQKNGAFHTKINGVSSYCMFQTIGDTIVGRVVSDTVLYQQIPSRALVFLLCMLVIAGILVLVVSLHLNQYVIQSIYDINSKLRMISAGNLDESVQVYNCLEFAELSEHINEMIDTLLSGTDKISYILNQTNLPIGVYEYSEQMAGVRFTEYVPQILNLDQKTAALLSADNQQFKSFIKQLHNQEIRDEGRVFRLSSNEERYVKLDEISHGNDIIGIVMDVTDQVLSRRKIIAERDHDLLTGLYNRRGLDRKLTELFANPQQLGYGALFMIDADGLKGINDKLGHAKGDLYLKEIAGMLGSFGKKSSLAARQGGDEFVLFLYHYDSEQQLLDAIGELEALQDSKFLQFDENVKVTLRFSIGYALSYGQLEYAPLIKEADQKMYQNKQARKARRGGT